MPITGIFRRAYTYAARTFESTEYRMYVIKDDRSPVSNLKAQAFHRFLCKKRSRSVPESDPEPDLEQLFRIWTKSKVFILRFFYVIEVGTDS